MIYELRNKVPPNSSFIRSEDVLTSTIFGNLRYFSNQNLLVGFLNQSINVKNIPLKLFLEDDYIIKFWGKYSMLDYGKINEPDLIILDKKNVVIIECKYFSSLDEEGDIVYDKNTYNNQLIRYSKIIEEYYSIKKEKTIIFLTNDRIIPIDLLNNTMEKIDDKIQLYWLSWSKIYKCLKQFNVDTLNRSELLLYEDLLDFVKIRNLTEFCGFEIGYVPSFNFYRNIFCFSKMNSHGNIWRFKDE